MPDDLDRDKMYTAGADDPDDDGDYELEPIDPEILAAEERRAAEALDAHKKSIDIDEIYRDSGSGPDSEAMQELVQRLRSYRFQFQIKHLLILTAVVAMLLALRQWGVSLVTFFVLAFMGAVGVLTLYLKWEENKRQQAADRRRHQMYAERRAHLLRQSGQDTKKVEVEPTPPEPLEEIRRQTAAVRDFRFQFSLAQFLVVLSCAALLLGLVSFLGGPSNVGTLCGFIALAGLAIYALGYQPPDIVAFSWWVMLVLYVVLSLLSAVWTGSG